MRNKEQQRPSPENDIMMTAHTLLKDECEKLGLPYEAFISYYGSQSAIDTHIRQIYWMSTSSVPAFWDQLLSRIPFDPSLLQRPDCPVSVEDEFRVRAEIISRELAEDEAVGLFDEDSTDFRVSYDALPPPGRGSSRDEEGSKDITYIFHDHQDRSPYARVTLGFLETNPQFVVYDHKGKLVQEVSTSELSPEIWKKISRQQPIAIIENDTPYWRFPLFGEADPLTNKAPVYFFQIKDQQAAYAYTERVISRTPFLVDEMRRQVETYYPNVNDIYSGFHNMVVEAMEHTYPEYGAARKKSRRAAVDVLTTPTTGASVFCTMDGISLRAFTVERHTDTITKLTVIPPALLVDGKIQNEFSVYIEVDELSGDIRVREENQENWKNIYELNPIRYQHLLFFFDYWHVQNAFDTAQHGITEKINPDEVIEYSYQGPHLESTFTRSYMIIEGSEVDETRPYKLAVASLGTRTDPLQRENTGLRILPILDTNDPGKNNAHNN